MRVLVTGLSTYWGGRVAQALEQRPDVEVVVGLDTRDPRVPLERTEFVRTDSTYSILARIVHATQVDTIVHTHLIVDSTRVSGRTLHEINVIGTMNLLAAAGASGSPVRKVVVKSSGLVYGANAGRPVLVPRGHDAHRPAAHQRRAVAARGRGVRARLRRRQPARRRHAAALRQRARRRHRHAVRARAAPAGRARDLRLRPARAVRARGRRRRRARCTRRPTTSPASTTSPATATCRGARCARSSASAASRCRSCSRTSRPSRCACCGSGTCRPRRCSCCATAARSTTRATSAPGFRYQYTTAGTVEAFAAGLRLAEHGRRQAPDVPLRARGRRLLPPLARRRPTGLRTHDGTRTGRTSRRGRGRHARRRRAPQRDDRRDGRRDRRRRSTRSRPTARRPRSWSPASRPRSAPAPTSSNLGALAARKTDGERRTVTSIYEGFLRVLRSPLPTVAAVNGPAVGAGMNLALACDVRIAGASARFDTRFLQIGLHPGGGHTWMLERAVGPAGRGRDGAVRRARSTGPGPPRSAWPGRAIPTTSSSTRRSRSRQGAARAPVPLLGRVKATLREAPWQPDFDAAVADRGHAAGLVAGPGLVRSPDLSLTDCPHCVSTLTGSGDVAASAIPSASAHGRGARQLETFRCPDLHWRPRGRRTRRGAARAARACAAASLAVLGDEHRLDARWTSRSTAGCSSGCTERRSAAAVRARSLRSPGTAASRRRPARPSPTSCCRRSPNRPRRTRSRRPPPRPAHAHARRARARDRADLRARGAGHGRRAQPRHVRRTGHRPEPEPRRARVLDAASRNLRPRSWRRSSTARPSSSRARGRPSRLARSSRTKSSTPTCAPSSTISTSRPAPSSPASTARSPTRRSSGPSRRSIRSRLEPASRRRRAPAIPDRRRRSSSSGTRRRRREPAAAPRRRVAVGSRPSSPTRTTAARSAIDEAGDELVAAFLPLLGGDRVAHVIFVDALDLQEPLGRSFVA